MIRKCLLAVFTVFLISCGKSEPTFDALGVYVPTDDGFVQLEPASRDNFDGDATLTSVNEGGISFFIYEPSLDTDKVVVMQSGFIKSKPKQLKHQIIPLEKQGTYEIKAQLPDIEPPLIVLKTGGFLSAKVYFATVGNIEQHLVAELKAQQSGSTRSRLKLVSSALKSYPSNAELQEMHANLQALLKEESARARLQHQKHMDDLAFKKAADSERAYQNKDKWIEQYQNYLNQYPKGRHSEKAQQRITSIQGDIEAANLAYRNQLMEFDRLTHRFVNALKSKDKKQLTDLAYQARNVDRWLRSSRLTDGDYAAIKVDKFHYSNQKSRDYAYVQLSGAKLKRINMKKRDDKWLVAGYTM